MTNYAFGSARGYVPFYSIDIFLYFLVKTELKKYLFASLSLLNTSVRMLAFLLLVKHQLARFTSPIIFLGHDDVSHVHWSAGKSLLIK